MWKNCRDDPNDSTVHSKSFKFKINETGKAPVAGNNTKGFKNRNAVKILN